MLYKIMANKSITLKQQKVLDFIKEFKEKTKITPTYRDIAKGLNLAIGSVQQHILALEIKGKIKCIPKISRGILIIEEVKNENM